MKHSITILLLSLCMCGYGQDTTYSQDSSIKVVWSDAVVKYSSIWRIGIYDDNFENGSFINLYKDSQITIQGDTLKLLRFIFTILSQKDSIIRAKDKVIAAAVNYTNHVSDYYKNEVNACGWNKYQYYLKKNGYTISKLKEGQELICE